MKKTLMIAGAALCLTVSAPLADDHKVTAEEEAKIMALLTEMQCEMDADDIEKEDDGYELDDVFCSDGQYDIDLNADFEVTNKKAE
ncbi:MAG: PepSY domain-containing protein [Pseudomonadota bacterium]